MKKIRAVILDFDGVLAESNQEKEAAFEEFFALYPEHRQAMHDFHLSHRPHPRREKFTYYVEVLMGCPGDRQLVEEMVSQFSEMVFNRVIACPPVLGSIEFLQEFSSRIPLYISSVTPQEELQGIIRKRGIETYITEAFGNPPISKEEAIAQVLERERVGPDEVAFVGDSLSDYKSATAAGLIFWGRDSGQSFGDAKVELYPDLHAIAAVVRERL